MKKVVLLAPYFLPRRRVGSWRPFKFAIHLRDFGWQPHVITIKETAETLTKKEARLLENIPIYEIKPPFDFTHKIGPQLHYNGRAVGVKQTASDNSKSIFKPALNWIDKHFPVDTWLPLFLLRQGDIEQYVAKLNPHLLWSTGDPWSSHWLAKKLAEKFNLPWVADFRDPWTLGDVDLKNRSGLAQRIDHRQEKEVIQKASILTFTSRQTEALYARRYASQIQKSKTIYNSFDSSLFKPNHSGRDFFDDGHLNLIFFGKFRPLSPAESFIRLLHQIRQENPNIAEKIRMYSFGSLSSHEKALVESKGIADNFISFKPIALEDALPLLIQADILWLSTHPGRTNIIPAKLWDYLAARQPILSVAPNPEIQSILQQTGAGVQFDLDNCAAIIRTLCEAVCAKQKKQSIPINTRFDDNAIKQYDADVATQKLADIFDRLI